MAEPRTDTKDAERFAALPSRAPFYVVGIGASAGALGALRTLLGEMPASPGYACVVVVHLAPDHESHLAELLQPYTQMPVRQVGDTVALERNRVYVIPPNANLNSIDTHLRLSALPERPARAPIDHFLRTLAATRNGHAVGVILTGAGSDGALGLRQIKELGGLTIAQDPSEAEYDSMPRAAIDTGVVDHVLPLRDIPNAIHRFCATQPRLPVVDENDGIDADGEAMLAEILSEASLRTDQELTVYKRSALLPRIGRRMQLHHVEKLSEYLGVLRNERGEAQALVDDLVATTTEFFREPELFERLAEDVLPSLLDRKGESGLRLRVWTLGCSSGEEAYSLAMLMIEAAERREPRPQLQVFASDLSDGALRRAREGVFPREIAADVSAERLDRFFVDEKAHFRAGEELRDIIFFAVHDLFKDPPYSHLDLVVCRELLGNLQPEIRQGVLGLFHYALEPSGVLIVGADNKVDEPSLFEPVDKRLRIYRRAAGPRRPLALPARFRPSRRDELEVSRPLAAGASGSALELAGIHRLLVEPFMPPSVLVDARNDVVHYSLHAGRYVRLPGGEPTHDLLKLVDERLREPLRIGLDAVRRESTAWESAPLSVRTAGGPRRIVLRLEPAPIQEPAGLVGVIFDELRPAPRPVADPARIQPADTIAELEAQLAEAQRQIRDLLAALGEDRGREAPATPSDLATASGLTADRELRELLEELQSSREELEVVNEELRTLDEENRLRLDDLSQLSRDMQHLLESTGIATLFLDSDLNIVRYTPHLGDLFNVRYADRGRPIADLTNALGYDDLETDARRVLEHLVPVDRELLSASGLWYLTRLLPYRTTAGGADGVVVSFIDITDRKQAEQRLRETDRRKDEFLAVLAHELRNPLAPITSGVELLKAAGRDARIVEQVTAMLERQSRQLVRLVDDLLDVSRISGGRLQLRKSSVRLADAVRDASEAVRPLLERRGHELSIELPEEPIVLDADAARLTQVVANLLSNAARYTLTAGRIDLSVQREGDEAVVRVKDTGVGMSEPGLERAFEMFYQSKDPRLVGNTGLGIGLTLAKSLVEMHGGTISADSPGVDRGSTFTLRLPIAGAESAAAETAPDEPAQGLDGHRVLIVDDNADAARTLGMVVRRLGRNEVHTVSTGAHALEAAAELRPDIAFLDLKMPGMDGYEVARRIREQAWGRDILLVALTGWGQHEHKQLTQAAGFDRHLTKPADRAALEAVLSAGRRGA